MGRYGNGLMLLDLHWSIPVIISKIRVGSLTGPPIGGIGKPSPVLILLNYIFLTSGPGDHGKLSSDDGRRLVPSVLLVVGHRGDMLFGGDKLF